MSTARNDVLAFNYFSTLLKFYNLCERKFEFFAWKKIQKQKFTMSQ